MLKQRLQSSSSHAQTRYDRRLNGARDAVTDTLAALWKDDRALRRAAADWVEQTGRCPTTVWGREGALTADSRFRQRHRRTRSISLTAWRACVAIEPNMSRGTCGGRGEGVSGKRYRGVCSGLKCGQARACGRTRHYFQGGTPPPTSRIFGDRVAERVESDEINYNAGASRIQDSGWCEIRNETKPFHAGHEPALRVSAWRRSTDPANTSISTRVGFFSLRTRRWR